MPDADQFLLAAEHIRKLHQGAVTRSRMLQLATTIHSNKRGDRITFRDRPCMAPLYTLFQDLPGADVRKAVQMGLTELLLCLSLHDTGFRVDEAGEDAGRIVAYVLPTHSITARFVQERVDPLLERTPAYKARMGGEPLGQKEAGEGSISRKAFGKKGSILFLNSESPANWKEYSADTFIIDEFDECDQSHVEKAWDRLQASKYPRLFRLSNPVIAGRGIDKLYKDGSRGRWFQPCSLCGHEQALDWFRHVVYQDDQGLWRPRDQERESAPHLGDLRPLCERCRRPFRRIPRGRWLHERTPSRIHLQGIRPSFTISQLDVLPSAGLPQPIRAYFARWVLAQENLSALDAFYAGVLGQAYEATGSRITVDILDRARKDQPPMDLLGGEAWKGKQVVMGVDVGALLNVKISETATDASGKVWRESIWIGTVPTFEAVLDLVKRYHVRCTVIDAAPETHKAKELATAIRALGYRAYLCRFWPQGRIGDHPFALEVDWSEGLVTVDRTQLLDITLGELQALRSLLPSDSAALRDFDEQMIAPARIQKGARIVWDESGKPDHYRFADAYERVAADLIRLTGGVLEI